MVLDCRKWLCGGWLEYGMKRMIDFKGILIPSAASDRALLCSLSLGSGGRWCCVLWMCMRLSGWYVIG